MKKLVILLFLAINVLQAFAGKENFSARITGNDIAVNNSFYVVDDKFPYMLANPTTWDDDFKMRSVNNTVFFYLDPANQVYYGSAFDVTVDLTITYIDEDFNQTSVDTSLIVDFDPDEGDLSTDRSAFHFTGGHRVEVEVTGITSSITQPMHLVVEAVIDVERYYDFDHTDLVTYINDSLDTACNVLEVYWDFIDGAEEYDLEWCFVNDYDGTGGYIDAADLNIDFRFNSTRITTSNNYYRIPMIYEHGYLVYRVRGVSRHWDDFDVRVDGLWSSNAKATVYLFGDKYAITTPHASDTMNWQYGISYTEDGKRSESIGYLDGTLRNRQQVGKVNTTNEAIVQETFYDYQGRPAVFTLPAPADTCEIVFQRNFNLDSASLDPFAAEHFDKDTDPQTCAAEGNALSTTSGAARYYSPDNPDQDGQQAYVPDADGYPYVRVEYTSDLTGRIRRQGGLGRDHQLESGHETEFYYAKPFQKKIDKLFGTEGGYSEHYKKNMVKDANGQLSISYFDQSGRVVATSLAGGAPASMDTIDNKTNAVADTTSLLDNNNTVLASNTGGIVGYQKFLVTNEGTHYFDYSIRPGMFEDLCLNENVCFDCIYNLEISIKDECGNEMIDNGNPIIDTVGHVPFDSICNDDEYVYVYASDSFSMNLPVGAYTMSKTLYINTQATDYYTCQYIEEGECLKTYSDFYNFMLDSADFEGCGGDYCYWECIKEIGTRDTFSGTEQEYDSLMADCRLTCLEPNPCESYLNAMKNDLSPGGQYAQFWFNDTILPDSFPLSILNENNEFPNDTANWRNPNSAYEDQWGNPDSIILLSGLKVPPQHDSVDVGTFIANWKKSWANSLVAYHPEYCYIEWCDSNLASQYYDMHMMATITYGAAKDSGFFNPLDTTTTGGVPSVIGANNNRIDPFFTADTSEVDTLMAHRMKHFWAYDTCEFTMWEAAILTAYNCLPDSSCTDYNTCLSNHTFGNDTCKNDMVWQIFRKYYLSEKSLIYDSLQIRHAILGGCYNGCIGQDTFLTYLNSYDCGPDWVGPHCNPSVPGKQSAYADTNQTCHDSIAYLFAEKSRIFSTFTYVLDSIDLMDSITQASFAQGCQDRCEGYADGWMSVLSGCGMSAGDSADVRAELIELCVLGCDSLNTFGSLTAPPGEMTSNGNTNVDEVLIEHLGPTYADEVCNAAMLMYPMDYGHNYGGTAYADTCACEKILVADSVYHENPDTATTLEAFFLATNGVLVGNMKSKVCLCANAFNENGGTWEEDATWGTEPQDFLDSVKVVVPPMLTCESCMTCTAFDLHTDTFETDYAVDSTDTYYYIMMSTYMNNKLDLNLGPQDYQQFKENCDSLSKANAKIFTNMTDEAFELEELLSQLAKTGLLTTSHTNRFELDTSPKFNFMFPKTLGGYSSEYEYWTCQDSPQDDCDDTTLTIHIGDGGTYGGCEIVLTMDEYNHKLQWDDVIRFRSIKPDTATDCGTVYDFVMEAWYVDCGHVVKDTVFGTSDCYPISDAYCSDSLLLCNKPYFPTATPYDTMSCYNYQVSLAENNALEQYQQYIDSVKTEFRAAYINQCLKADTSETFTMRYEDYEYHYTLYYYDQAGNLAKTVPPAGVSPLGDGSVSSVRTERDEDDQSVVPSHSMETDYRYNSYNRVVQQNTPDGGTSTFWYDVAGRMVVSQNAKQAAADSNLYSYTIYDDIGRIAEVGQIENPLDIRQTITQDPDSLEDWFDDGSGNQVKTQITRTFYDSSLTDLIASRFAGGHNNLRLRVSTIAYYETDDVDTAYSNATHFAYDPHGNINEVIHEIPELEDFRQDIKRVEYEYELASGNLTNVFYQRDSLDQFMHHYEYDADNRLKEIFTSSDSVIFDRDAKYFYFDHGPLARAEMGDLKVQGIDYVYSIHGWLKGINSNTLDSTRDIGNDAATGFIASNDSIHKKIGRDAYGFTLGYYEGDYTAISEPSATNNFEASITSSGLLGSGASLYNGNISHQVTAIEGFDIHGYAYTYDQLNRIKQSEAFNNLTVSTNSWGAGSGLTEYKTNFTYDANGNLQTLTRNGSSAQTNMDDFTYNYINGKNQLEYVDDVVAAGNYGTDIDDQSSGNYMYDQTGNLTKDVSENIDSIYWTVYGRVDKIIYSSGSVDSVDFNYNAAGHRISKSVHFSNNDVTYTYYGMDLQNNVLGVYTREYDYEGVDDSKDSIMISEHSIYGRLRLGTKTSNTTLACIDINPAAPGTDTIITFDTLTMPTRTLGNKHYEHNNHLGNVNLTFTDKRVEQDSDSDGSIDYITADISSKQDYYSFGSIMPNRNTSSSSYRYGFGAMEKDDEVNSQTGGMYYTEFRMNDPRLGGRWLSIDPVVKPWESPYVGYSNNPIAYNDPSGLNPEETSASGTGGDKKVIPTSEVSSENFGEIDVDNTVLELPEFEVVASQGSEGGGSTTPSGGGDTPTPTNKPDIDVARTIFKSIPNNLKQAPPTNNGSVNLGDVDFGKLLHDNDDLFRRAIQNSPTTDIQRKIFFARYNYGRKEGAKFLAITLGVATAPVTAGLLIESAIAVAPTIYSGASTAYGAASAAYFDASLSVYGYGSYYLGTVGTAAGSGILASRYVGANSRLFGKGSGILNNGVIRVGWSYNKEIEKFTFGLRVGNNPRWYEPTKIMGKTIHKHFDILQVKEIK